MSFGCVSRTALTGTAAFLLAGCGGDLTPPEPPPVTLDLSVGESAIVAGGEPLSGFVIKGGSGPREYRIAVQSASQVASGKWPMSFNGAPSGSASVASASAGVSAASASARAGALMSSQGADDPRRRAAFLAPSEFREEHFLAEMRLRRSARRELLRIGARPARSGAGGVSSAGASRALVSAAFDVPSVGETQEFLFAIQEDLSVSCTDTAAVITASVRAVGDHFAILRDTQGPGWFTAADYSQMLATLEDVIHPVNAGYFGEPADIDGNERVLVLITEETNKLSEPNGLTFLAGFFVPSDLSDSGTGSGGGGVGSPCATSNEAEILYLLAPDPTGDFGRRHTVDFARENVVSVSSHELQHLISAEQRLIFGAGGFGDLEEVWVDEGLSHLAEELGGLAAAGLSVRLNLTFEDVLQDVDTFNTFHLSNFKRLGGTSGGGGWLRNPENTETIAPSDPGGPSSLRFRGFAWIFMRWLGDQEGPAGSGVIPGSSEQSLFRELVSGGPLLLKGIANVERVVQQLGSGRSWAELLDDFLISPAADDQAEGASARTQLLTWDLPSVFLGLHENEGTATSFTEEYPLDMETFGLVPVAEQFTVRSSTAKYFSLQSAAEAPDYEVRLLDTAGLPLSPATFAQVTVIRVR